MKKIFLFSLVCLLTFTASAQLRPTPLMKDLLNTNTTTIGLRSAIGVPDGITASNGFGTNTTIYGLTVSNNGTANGIALLVAEQGRVISITNSGTGANSLLISVKSAEPFLLALNPHLNASNRAGLTLTSNTSWNLQGSAVLYADGDINFRPNNFTTLTLNDTNAVFGTNVTTLGQFIGNGAGITNLNDTNAIAKVGGSGTNATLDGATLFQGRFSGPDEIFSVGTLLSGRAGIGNPFGQVELQLGTLGGMVMTKDRKDIFEIATPDFNGGAERQFKTVWNSAAPGNQIRSTRGQTYNMQGYRRPQAASDAYINALGGSASAMSDMPSRGPEIWANQPKPFMVISLRDNILSSYASTTQAALTNGVNGFRDPGYIAYCTNNNIPMSFSIEDTWLQQHRDPTTGLLRWNTTTFPMVAGHDTYPTNLTRYLATNKIETWLMLYALPYVPSTASWYDVGSSYPELDTDFTGNLPYWEYPGGNGGVNPFSNTNYIPAMTFDTIHRDVSSFYTWGVSGLLIQDGVYGGSGAFDQVIRTVNDAVLNPYINPGLASQQFLDVPWNYAGIYTNIGNHAMSVNYFLGTAGREWPLNRGLDANGLYVESNGSLTPPLGSAGIGWIMGQVRGNANFLTNQIGLCRMIPGTDGPDFSNYTYKDWKNYMSATAFFNMNRWFTGSGGYGYFANSGFGTALTNNYVNTVWRDQSQIPYTCVSLAPSNGVWARTLSDGSKLVLMHNEGSTTTNLTVTWGQLGFPSNTVMFATEVVTNAVIGDYTNSITVAVPSADGYLIRLRQPTVGSFTGNGQGITNLSAKALSISAGKSSYELRASDWTTATANGGSVTPGKKSAIINTGATANGRGTLHFGVGGGDSPLGLGPDNSQGDIVNWSIPYSFSVTIALYTNGFLSANPFLQAAFGHNSGTTSGVLGGKGIGFKITAGATSAIDPLLSVVRHNGTTLTTTSTGLTLNRSPGVSGAIYTMHTVVVESDGTGNVTIYLDGTNAGTYTGGPTGLGGADNNTLLVELNNGGDTTAAYQIITGGRIWWGN